MQTGEFGHVELASGNVAVLAAWKIDAVYCAGLKVGAPQVSLEALCASHELLIARESRQVAAGDNIVTGIATACTKDGGCSEAEQAPDSTTPVRPRSRRCPTSEHDSGGALSSSEVGGAPQGRR